MALPDSSFLFVEPESAASIETPPEYPYNTVTRTNSGHYFELDDTPERERVRLQHRTGTFLEMHPDGTQVNHIIGESYHIIDSNGVIRIAGRCSVTVDGDAQLVFNGDLTQRVVGDYNLEVGGDFNTKVNGNFQTTVNKNLYLTTGILGSIQLTSVYTVYINSDLSINGEVRAGFLHSNGGINATGAIHTNLGLSTLGGIIQGGTVAPPTGITALGPIQTPLTVTGMEIFDKSGPMSLFKAAYNTHFHITPHGTSSTPIKPVP